MLNGVPSVSERHTASEVRRTTNALQTLPRCTCEFGNSKTYTITFRVPSMSWIEVSNLDDKAMDAFWCIRNSVFHRNLKLPIISNYIRDASSLLRNPSVTYFSFQQSPTKRRLFIMSPPPACCLDPSDEAATELQQQQSRSSHFVRDFFKVYTHCAHGCITHGGQIVEDDGFRSRRFLVSTSSPAASLRPTMLYPKTAGHQ
ncbi:hypothetical protein EVAR_75641_1 [Eumeta japonica]|uniref:Uncharacterized protein n=1 Tax=Eumeta variegata TaxID=151549 RepID=A0A4C1U049_EUMVA|nr:hypothetical protein EVAR_75641_1 [Eumeta japonica]